jgi:propionyl-CoA synthetase
VSYIQLFWRFAPHELAIRIDDCKPRLIITVLVVDRLITYKPLVDEAIELASHRPKKVIVFNRKLELGFRLRSMMLIMMRSFTDLKRLLVFPLVVHPCTTGKPKGVVRDTEAMQQELKSCNQSTM